MKVTAANQIGNWCRSK